MNTARPMVPPVWRDSFDYFVFNRRVLGLLDRVLLERRILPALAGLGVKCVLFVGTAWFTQRYAKIFEDQGIEYWTLDRDEVAGPYGHPVNHVTADLQDVGSLFAADAFDAVILNGVFGFGIDSPSAMDASLRTVAQTLRPGGWLLLGWNPNRIADPLHLEAIWTLYSHAPMAEFPARVLVHSFEGHQHIYDFFVRVGPAGQREER